MVAGEPTAGRVIDIYQRHAIAWSRDRGDRLHEKAWLDRFLALLPDRPTVLDIGCGSGVPMGRYLIENRCRLTGIDASSAMVSMCADRFSEQEWHVADMRTLDLNRKFDGIVAWDSFFHLPQEDQRRMFPIFARHAAAGAAADVHQRPIGRRTNWPLSGGAAIPRKPGPRRIPRTSARQRLPRRDAHGRRSGVWRPHHLAGATRITAGYLAD